VWLYVGLGIKFILWVARFIAAAPGATLHVRGFAPAALCFLSLAVLSALLWRSWLFRSSALPLAALGLIAALDGPRFDAIIAPSGDLAAVRDGSGHLQIVGRHFNAFAAEQWLAADGDDPASARAARALCDRSGCSANLPEGRLLSLVTERSAFAEDCARATVVASALDAPAGCKAETFDRGRLALTGAVGLTFDGARLAIAADRSPLQDRPWSPAPRQAGSARSVPPPSNGSTGADPADAPADEQ